MSNLGLRLCGSKFDLLTSNSQYCTPSATLLLVVGLDDHFVALFHVESVVHILVIDQLVHLNAVLLDGVVFQ